MTVLDESLYSYAYATMSACPKPCKMLNCGDVQNSCYQMKCGNNFATEIANCKKMMGGGGGGSPSASQDPLTAAGNFLTDAAKGFTNFITNSTQGLGNQTSAAGQGAGKAIGQGAMVFGLPIIVVAGIVILGAVLIMKK